MPNSIPPTWCLLQVLVRQHLPEPGQDALVLVAASTHHPASNLSGHRVSQQRRVRNMHLDG